MQSMALSSESVYLRTTHFAKPLKFSKFCTNFKISCPKKFLALSRYSRKQHVDINDSWSGHFSLKDFNKSHRDDLKISERGMCNTAIFTDERSSISNDSSSRKLTGEHEQFSDLQYSFRVQSHKYLKFMLLCGFFTLQSTQQAVAGSDIAFLLIFFSELGDKTFFIAALLAARNSTAVVFLGTFGALGVMTIISVVLGRTFHYVDEILPFRLGGNDLPVDDIAAVFLLVYFGVSTLLDAASSDGLKAEEEQKERLLLHRHLLESLEVHSLVME